MAQVQNHFIPVRFNIHEQRAPFKRFQVFWTPTVLILDSEGAERYRLEGFLPREEFSAQMEFARARLALVQKRWQAAEEILDGIIHQSPGTLAAPDAIYWAAVCQYSRSHDHAALGAMALDLQRRYPASLAAKKAIPFL